MQEKFTPDKDADILFYTYGTDYDKMKTLIKVLTIIIILTTNAYSEDNHKDHDHDNHDKDGFYGHLDVAIFADSMTKVANDGKYKEIYSHTHAEIGNRFS